MGRVDVGMLELGVATKYDKKYSVCITNFSKN